MKADALINAVGMLTTSVTLYIAIAMAPYNIVAFWVFAMITQIAAFIGWAPNTAIILVRWLKLIHWNSRSRNFTRSYYWKWIYSIPTKSCVHSDSKSFRPQTSNNVKLTWFALFQYTTPALMRSLAQAVNILFSHLLGDAISPTIQGEVIILTLSQYSDTAGYHIFKTFYSYGFNEILRRFSFFRW